MLDDKDYIARIDSDNGLGLTAKQPGQLDYSFDLDLKAASTDIAQVVAVGMGGSALAADICRNWWADRLEVSFEIVRNYNLPKHVGARTLVICSSYSGNTEEVLGVFEAARERQAQVVVISSGGELESLARSEGVPLIKIPTGYQPRMATWYGIKALTELFEGLGLVSGARNELERTASLLFAAAKDWEVQVATADNYAKQIAEQLMGKAVWVYAGPMLASAAYKWKISFNENAKSLASCNVLPEFNHNEFLGWTSHPLEKPFGVVELRSHLDHPRVQKRFDTTNRLLSGRMPAPIEVEAKGETQIEQLLWTCLLGDFTSIYTGILHGVNPVRVDAIEKFKTELG